MIETNPLSRDGTHAHFAIPCSKFTARITGLPERRMPGTFPALVDHLILPAPNRPRCRVASSQRRVFDMRV